MPQKPVTTLFPLPVPSSIFKHTLRKPSDPVLCEALAESTPKSSTSPPRSRTQTPEPADDLYDSDPPINYHHPLTPARTSRKRRRPTSAPTPRAAPTQRQSHLCALNTLLHRSLITRDFIRARRAFGLLLRSKDIDLRLCWKTGLRILRETEGLETATFFLELLKIRFPYRKTVHANYVSDEHLALLCEELRQRILDEREQKRLKYLHRPDHPDSDDHDEGEETEHPPSSPPSPQTDTEAIEAILNPSQPEAPQATKKKRRQRRGPRTIFDSSLQFHETLFELQYPSSETLPEDLSVEEREKYRLQRATTLKSQLVETMLTPPYSDSLRLWFLRAKVNLLLGELLKPSLEDMASTDRQEWEREWSIPSSMRSDAFDLDGNDKGSAWRLWKKGVEDARHSLEECMARGGDVSAEMWEGVKGLEEWADGMREDVEVGQWINSQGVGGWGSQMPGASQTLPVLLEGVEVGSYGEHERGGRSDSLVRERNPDSVEMDDDY